VPPAKLFAVEPFDFEIVRAPRLPVHVTPFTDEALASWLLRFADPFGVSPQALLLGDTETEFTIHPEWWRRPDAMVLAALARRTGVAADRIKALSLADPSGDSAVDAMPERFARQRYTSERPMRQARRIGVCPGCLADDEQPYIRRDWTLGWVAACAEHGAVLVRQCPGCGAQLRLPALSSGDHFAPHRCSRCAFALGRTEVWPAADAVIRFQQRLLIGRPLDLIDLPGVGELDWESAVALFDVLLGAVWIDTKPGARDQLFVRIARDLNTAPFGSAPHGGYEGLAILAWMFEGWPERVQVALAILRAVRPRRQLLRWPDLDEKVRRRVEDMLLPCWPDERSCPNRAWWRSWIDNLPETTEELRTTAARERLPHRRARLMAIADVRDGVPVEIAADLADVMPRTLYIWLKRGAAGGLDAALERPRWQYLTEPQVMELAEWISTASPDGPRWRANRVQNETRRRFGVEISVHVAGRLLRKHGPWRRRKVLAKRRLTVAPVYDRSDAPVAR
jgi:transposase